MTYDVIGSGSKGNAVIFNDIIMVDCGVSFKKIKEICGNLRLVLLTHIHSDHFNKTAIKLLAQERPTLRFGCCEWLVEDLYKCGVELQNIDVMAPDKLFDYGLFRISPVSLVHDVPNCGYRLFLGHEKIIYITDTANLNGIEAKNYDYYFIEANYDEDEIKERISEKEANGEYTYEKQVLNRHLSFAQCNNFIYENMGANSRYVYLHQHQERNV